MNFNVETSGGKKPAKVGTACLHFIIVFKKNSFLHYIDLCGSFEPCGFCMNYWVMFHDRWAVTGACILHFNWGVSTTTSFAYSLLYFQYLRLSDKDSVDACLEFMQVFWHIMEPSPPNLVISVVGGAKNFRLDGEMRDTFSNGLIKVCILCFGKNTWRTHAKIFSNWSSNWQLLNVPASDKIHQSWSALKYIAITLPAVDSLIVERLYWQHLKSSQRQLQSMPGYYDRTVPSCYKNSKE